jgi:sirohydrochlorin ferrochelatase
MTVATLVPDAGVLRPRSSAAAIADVVLAAHGSRDARAARDTRRLVAALAIARPDLRVREAYLDFTAPALGAALHGRFGPTTVVPLLLTPAYHARVDVPGVVDAAREQGRAVRTADVLGPAGDHDPALDLLTGALLRRMREAGVRRPDAVVVGAAGSRDTKALVTVERIADRLSARLHIDVRAGYASGAGRTVAEATRHLRDGGATRIAYASLFLAAGRLPDRAAEAARGASLSSIAAPLVDAPELVELIGIRIDAARNYGDS